eukprot:SAG31_NODE_1025_length_10289_cov_3.290677_11_plen_151_part_00
MQRADGSATNDPAVLFDEDNPGVAMGIGGQDHGHKGFGLGLMVEALTMGLAGFGRAELAAELGDMAKAQGLNDRPKKAVAAGMTTFVQVRFVAAAACPLQGSGICKIKPALDHRKIKHTEKLNIFRWSSVGDPERAATVPFIRTRCRTLV